MRHPSRPLDFGRLHDRLDTEVYRLIDQAVDRAVYEKDARIAELEERIIALEMKFGILAAERCVRFLERQTEDGRIQRYDKRTGEVTYRAICPSG